jgi:hypothetical protein
VWDWYTVEGPFVRQHGGRYYCFYSGGAWRESNYGVSYAVADGPMGPFSHVSDTEGPRVLRTRPGAVIGPGHASMTYAPDNVHEYLVYHAWDPEHTRRLMRIDPLNWEEGAPSSPGPSLEPVPAPPLPTFRDLFDGPDDAPPDPDTWLTSGGDWRQDHGALVQRDPEARPATAWLPSVPQGKGYLLEANVRLLDARREAGRYGVILEHGPGERTEIALEVDGSGSMGEHRLDLDALGPGFAARDYHQLLMSVEDGRAVVRLDGVRVSEGLKVPPAINRAGLFTHGASVAFDGVALTLLG